MGAGARARGRLRQTAGRARLGDWKARPRLLGRAASPRIPRRCRRDVPLASAHARPLPSPFRSRSGYVTYAVSAAGLGTVAYLVVWKGWRLSDFFYVTRRQMKQGMSMLSDRASLGGKREGAWTGRGTRCRSVDRRSRSRPAVGFAPAGAAIGS